MPALCSLYPVRQVESMNLWYLGTTPAALHRFSLQLSVPPQRTSNRGKTESLKASESPTTATLTIHTAMGIKKTNRQPTLKGERHLKIYPSKKSHFSCLSCYTVLRVVTCNAASLLKWNIFVCFVSLARRQNEGSSNKTFEWS